ncbi:MAG: cell division protein FtsA [Bernardetiaceae bacterium]|jgi:cell division protein FtsA|nr:cell division protein FtsA [Bernardetiaceae bacterium]
MNNEKNAKIVVGLDIGTTKVCAIVGQLDTYGKLEIIGMGRSNSDGVKEGVVSNINKTMIAIQEAVAEAERTSGIDIRSVNVGIAGKHIRSFVHRGSITRKNEDEITVDDVNRLNNDMYRTVTAPGSEIIHVMPQHYTVDYEENIKDAVGMAGVKLEADFHIITAQTNAIKNIKRSVELAGLTIENLILEPLASSLAVLSEEEKEAGIVLVDIGGGTTDVAIFYDGIIRHTAVIPFGGEIVTSDIKQGCAVLVGQAEQLKVKFGRSLAEQASDFEVVSIPGPFNRPPKEISIKNLARIIEARMEEMVEMVHAEIVKSGYGSRLAGGIVVTGGGALLQNLPALFEFKTGLDTRIGYPNEHLGKSRDESVKSPMYATSVGLVLAGFRTIDEREENYLRSPQTATAKMPTRAGTPFVGGLKNGGDFFSNVLKKMKDLLIDDFDDNVKY